MHELSIAESLLDLVREHVPEGSVLTCVRVCAGPMRGIDPAAMQTAWLAATMNQPEKDSVLDVEYLPWQVTCGACGSVFDSDHVPASCACGSSDTIPSGSDELTLRSLVVEQPEPAARGA